MKILIQLTVKHILIFTDTAIDYIADRNDRETFPTLQVNSRACDRYHGNLTAWNVIFREYDLTLKVWHMVNHSVLVFSYKTRPSAYM